MKLKACKLTEGFELKIHMQNKRLIITLIVSVLCSLGANAQEALIAEWSFNQSTGSTGPSTNNIYGPSLADEVDGAAIVAGGFIGLSGFGAEGKDIGSPGDTNERPLIGTTENNNAMGLSGARSVLDESGDPDPSGTRALTITASTLYYSGELTISFHASHSYLGSRYYQILATSNGIDYLPVSGGTGSFSGDSLGINEQTSSSVTVSDDGIITWITDEGVVPSSSNGDAFVYEISYTFPAGSAYVNNPYFGFKIAEIHDPSGTDYVSSYAGTVFGQENGFTRASTYIDVIRITASEMPKWAGWSILSSSDVWTGDFLGWINVAAGDWIWSYSLGNYIYMPSSLVGEGGGWAYIPVRATAAAE